MLALSRIQHHLSLLPNKETATLIDLLIENETNLSAIVYALTDGRTKGIQDDRLI